MVANAWAKCLPRAESEHALAAFVRSLGFGRTAASRQNPPPPDSLSRRGQELNTRVEGSAVVSRLAVAGDVQAFALFLFRNPQADHRVNDFVGDEGDHARPDNRQQHRFELNPDLAGY